MLPADIARTRRALGLTQPQFGRVVGRTLWTVCRWENGATPVRAVRDQGALAALLKLVEILEEKKMDANAEKVVSIARNRMDAPEGTITVGEFKAWCQVIELLTGETPYVSVAPDELNAAPA